MQTGWIFILYLPFYDAIWDASVPSKRVLSLTISILAVFGYSNLLLKRVAEIQHDQLSDTAANPDDGHFRQTLTNPFSNEELQQALDSIGPNLSPDELWLPVVRYHVLRLMLTPVVEGLLLLDRLFRLQELGMLLLLLPLMTNNE
ncbi:hypothetical protein FBUS_10741 [Fasciolopsis buskii]|uniref:Uncharacterized protein n=1 Tax=Fasciolopsis buskii TaxID=27845 RepID=A0A8E0RT81_9TREM|nr:hypothetical protein FBUS_10741 [Fasciolopsis buski]